MRKDRSKEPRNPRLDELMVEEDERLLGRIILLLLLPIPLSMGLEIGAKHFFPMWESIVSNIITAAMLIYYVVMATLGFYRLYQELPDEI